MQQTKKQRGGTFLGFVLGVVVGLGVALAVAVYVTKVPVMFLNKTMGRTSEQDATEVQKNKDWNPNAALAGKNPATPAGPAEQTIAASTLPKPPVGGASAPAEYKPAVSADPLGDLAKARVAAAVAKPDAMVDPFTYFVQVGAYRTPEDAESQRAKLSLGGIETKVSEREQAGRIVYRVRQGPFVTRDEADKAKAALDGKGLETVLVRVQR